MLDDRGDEVVIGRTRGVDADEKLPGKLFEKLLRLHYY